MSKATMLVILSVFVLTLSQSTLAEIPARCHFHCPLHYRPVCGHNGGTYDNECLMRVSACEQGIAIIKIRDGRCPEDFNKRCQNFCPEIYAPVCGSDGKLYPNKCVLEARMCTTFKAITIVSSPGLKEKPSCGDCLIPCNKMLKPVCGSDGKTYSNECVMRTEACKSRKAIISIYDSPCKQ